PSRAPSYHTLSLHAALPISLSIARRYCGPPTTGNGGYSAGLLGRYIDGPTQVTLRSPPPLERPLRLARESDKLLLWDGEQLVAEDRKSTRLNYSHVKTSYAV